ncbi:PorP/SprF family type IX secretion system membrane protein [Allomuricauda sp. SCSIO 65647]|uniref:PorP/SprF family type IX secretion system membrane protein n=1 Tax=Allomuricauda sp. SCSIO 65647 TaxID=2908843 RepID=UPI001F3E45C9|nr:PorP/SprF family type IX secretion system membrane protein [Muricauda sp. SCSIO 65647]UJH67581.1 PorP/SprF family type IX secretion system membrane protein [Muricauda sp. SCSIO 65647]
MRNVFGFCVLLCISATIVAQEVSLPEDLRQHNLTRFNASLFNPTFSLDWNNPNALSTWTRWQWQTIDGNPTTLFFDYSGAITPESTFGIGFLQHNTGIFLNTGGIGNYAHSFDVGNGTRLTVGANVLAFQQELADDRFLSDDELDLPQLETSDSFVLQMTPGVRLQSGDFAIAMALENALEVNLSNNDRESTGTIFSGLLSYDLPVQLFAAAGESYVRPMLYLRSVPDADTQIGINALLATSIFWAQGGYNSFYGLSGGAGVTLFKKFSIGGLFEFATDSALSDENSTFELVASYHFGNANSRREVVEVEEEDLVADETKPQKDEQQEVLDTGAEDEKLRQREAELARAQQIQDSIARAEYNRKVQDSIAIVERAKKINDSIVRAEEAAKRLRIAQDSIAKANLVAAQLKREQDSIAMVERAKKISDSIVRVEEAAKRLRMEQDSIAKADLAAAQLKRAQDSIATAQRLERQLLADQRKKDSIAKISEEKVEIKPGEKYEEVLTADGLQPGFYLIANVFGTKKYFENFMKTLNEKGLEPKSFYRELNGYNYVYLKRFNTIEEARKARDSKYYGKYPDKTWIFRVKR